MRCSGMTRKLRFESSVISYGNQTNSNSSKNSDVFESSVISYGNQTADSVIIPVEEFESSVISYGNQTRFHRC